MEQLNFIMSIKIGMDMEDVEQIVFKFHQPPSKTLMFVYPSDTAVLCDNGIIQLHWTAEQAFKFESKKEIKMDTLIKVRNAFSNPETRIVSMTMNDTLFTLPEVEQYG